MTQNFYALAGKLKQLVQNFKITKPLSQTI